MATLIGHIHYCVFRCPCSQYSQWVQLVLCSSGHLDYRGVCLGMGSDCSMKCAVDAAVCHKPLVRTRCELDAVLIENISAKTSELL